MPPPVWVQVVDDSDSLTVLELEDGHAPLRSPR